MPGRNPPIPPIHPEGGTLLERLPLEFVRQLNRTGRRVLAGTQTVVLPADWRARTVLPGGQVLLPQNAPAWQTVHEAFHRLDINRGRLGLLSAPVRFPEPLTTAYQRAQYYQGVRPPITTTLTFSVMPRIGRAEVVASAVQREYQRNRPVSGIRRLGLTIPATWTRYFTPTALGLAGGLRSLREARMMRRS